MEKNQPEITFRGCLKRAWADTEGFKAWKREIGVAIIAGLLAWLFLPEQEAVNEWLAIAATVLAAVIIFPLLELAWNFAASPLRILNDRLGLIDERIEQLHMPAARSQIIDFEDPNYAAWDHEEYSILDAAFLWAGENPKPGSMFLAGDSMGHYKAICGAIRSQKIPGWIRNKYGRLEEGIGAPDIGWIVKCADLQKLAMERGRVPVFLQRGADSDGEG